MEHTKKTAAEIEDKVTEAKKTSAEIDKVRIPSLSTNQKISPGKGAVQILSSEGLRPLLHPQRSEQDQPHVPVLPQGVQRRVRRRHQGGWTHNQLTQQENYHPIFSACRDGLKRGPPSEKPHRLHHFPSVPVHNKVVVLTEAVLKEKTFHLSGVCLSATS